MQTINPYQMWQGSFVPNWLMRRPDINATAKLVYGRLCQYAGRDGLAYPSMDTLGVEVGIGRRQVLRVINQLEDVELIRRQSQTRDNGGKASNTYEFLAHKWINDDATSMTHTHATSETPPHATSMTHKENQVLRESKRRNSTNNPIADPITEAPRETGVAEGGGFVEFPNNKNQTPTQPEPNPHHPIPVPGHTPAQITTETYETVAQINGRIGTTGIPQGKHLRELNALVAEIGPARIVSIVDDTIDDIQAARNAWAYILGIIKNNKIPKPPANKCPECNTKGLHNKSNLRNYKTSANCAPHWVGVAHYECPKCKYRQKKGDTPIVDSKPDAAHHDQIKRAAYA